MSGARVWGRSTGPQRRHWRLVQDDDGFHLQTPRTQIHFSGSQAGTLAVGRSWFRPVLTVTDGEGLTKYRGLSRAEASSLEQALEGYLFRTQVTTALSAIVAWATRAQATMDGAEAVGRWIPTEATRALDESQPHAAVQLLSSRDRRWLAAALTMSELRALDVSRVDVGAWVKEVNERILASELVTRRDFFDRVEASPLTDEQARAVCCYDNRVLVVASAGSGKTSVMVARAAYAISRGFTTPDRILLLAFNKAAAVELQQRVDARLRALGMSSSGVRADTFHAFGLRAIGHATGRKPRPAPWLESGQDVAEVLRIIDELRDSSPAFRTRWDLFRLIYARTSGELEGDEPDAWDPHERRTGFRTFRNEVVRGQGEGMIADWLYLNGVTYIYEHPYSFDVADPEHSQYRPDFYYPDVDVWHEHWALDAQGSPRCRSPATPTAWNGGDGRTAPMGPPWWRRPGRRSSTVVASPRSPALSLPGALIWTGTLTARFLARGRWPMKTLHGSSGRS